MLFTIYFLYFVILRLSLKLKLLCNFVFCLKFCLLSDVVANMQLSKISNGLFSSRHLKRSNQKSCRVVK